MNRDDLMQIFRKVTRLGPQEARFYLETSAWDLAKALAEWREENRWEAQQVRRNGVVGVRVFAHPTSTRFFVVRLRGGLAEQFFWYWDWIGSIVPGDRLFC